MFSVMENIFDFQSPKGPILCRVGR